MMGVMLSAAGSLRWLRDAIAPTAAFEDLVEGANEIPAGSDGLLFLPYLTGERFTAAELTTLVDNVNLGVAPTWSQFFIAIPIAFA